MKSNIEVLTDRNLLSHFSRNEEDDWIVKFYAPWCGHCRNFAPMYQTLGSTIQQLQLHDGKDTSATSYPTEGGIDYQKKAYNLSHIQLGEVDCTEHMKLCEHFNITGFPTVKYINAEVSKSITFRKVRSLENLLDFVHTSKGILHPSPQSIPLLYKNMKDYRVDHIHYPHNHSHKVSLSTSKSIFFDSWQLNSMLCIAMLTLLALVLSIIQRKKALLDYEVDVDYEDRLSPSRVVYREKHHLHTAEDKHHLDLEEHQVLLEPPSSPSTVIPRKHQHISTGNETTESVNSLVHVGGDPTESGSHYLPAMSVSRNKRE